MPQVHVRGTPLFVTHNGIHRTPNLVLIHGAGGESRCWPAPWRLSADAAATVGLSLAPRPARITTHSVFALDLPGHGRSPGPALETVEAMADRVEAFLEAEDITDAVPVGHSMGGLVALTLAARRNPRLAGLVIVASAARLAVTDQILDGLVTDFPATVDFLVKYSFDRATPPFFPAKARDYTRATGPVVTRADFAACAAPDLRSSLAAIDLPVLVVASEGDRMVPFKHQTALAEALPKGECAVIAGAGHYPQLECTVETGRAIAHFADRLAMPPRQV